MTLRSVHRYNNLHFYDDRYNPASQVGVWASCPILAILADPYCGLVFFDDFESGSNGAGGAADIAKWAQTIVDGDTDGAHVMACANSAHGGWWTMTTNDKSGDGNVINSNGEPFLLAANKPLWYECRVAFGDVDKINFYGGLCIEDTEPYGGVTDGVAFRMDHDGNIDFVTEKNSSETATAAVGTVSDGGVNSNSIRLGFYFDGASSITPYIDGVAGTPHTTNIPNDEDLQCVFQVQTANAAAETLWIDYVKVVQIR